MTKVEALRNLYVALGGNLSDVETIMTIDSLINMTATYITEHGGGGGGSSITVDSALSETSTNPVQNKVITAELLKKATIEDIQTLTISVGNKVDKVTGKQLSTEDYTTAEKQKLAGLSNYDDTEVNSAISELQTEKASTDYVNDAINSVSAYYVTYDAAGNPFPTRAALTAATQFYYAGELRTPTKNDYCLVLSDETNDNASCRYVYTKVSDEPTGHWDLQYIVNATPFTEAQLAAINSGITSADKTAISNKVDKETGKGLSTEDFTTEEKTKLAGLSNYDDTAVNNAMVRADAPDEEGFSQLYKTVNGQRMDIDPKTSGGSTPYIYMTVDEYLEITPEADKLYWVINDEGKHGVYKNSGFVEGEHMLHIYGVSWGGTSTTSWTRTDDAANFSDPVPYVSGASSYGSPFDELMPWAGMVKEERTGGTMVKIPKFWYKITQISNNGIKIQVANRSTTGFHVSPAHMDRGDGKGERDYVYVGRYHCASDYKSKTGVKPVVNITRSTARTAIHNLGTNIWQSDFAMRFTLWLLYIVEFADWNSQAKIGAGCGNNSSTENMGYTDSMPYHTGTTLSNRTSKGLGTQYRNIEGLWDNVFDWTDGAYYNDNGMNIILNPANFSDSAGGTLIGKPSSGYPSKFSVVDTNGAYQMFYPTEASGNATTYSCDYWHFDTPYPCICVGGCYDHYDSYGMFCISCSTSTDSDGNIGSRTMELP